MPTASVHVTSQLSSNHTPAGAIAGGVVGGIVLIVLLAIAAFVYHRRRHGGVDKIVNIRRGGARQSDIEPATHINPFMDPGMSQANVRAVTAGLRDPSRTSLVTSSNSASATMSTFLQVANAPSTILSDDDPSVSSAAGRSHKKGASSTSLWVFPADTPGASRDALVAPSPPKAPLLPTIPSSTTQPSSTTRAMRPAHMPQQRSRKATMRREELSRQVRDIENAVADLRRRQSTQSARTVLSPGSPPAPPLPGSPGSEDSDAVLRRQIESLQLEVERLRAEQDLLLREPPPAYRHGEEEGCVDNDTPQ